MSKRILLWTLSILSTIICYAQTEQFVSIGANKKFRVNNVEYYPMILNYRMNIVQSGTEIWASPHHSYGHSNGFECTTKADCLIEMKNQFQVIKDMGFNAIRLVGGYQVTKFSNTNLGHTMDYLPLSESNVNLNGNYSYIFSCLDDVLSIAADRGLKVIIVLGTGSVDEGSLVNEYSDYLELIADHFKNNTTILAYDLRNEPLRESRLENNMNKSQMCAEVSSWISRMKVKDPNHLITIGFQDTKEVLKWDPMMIPVDFASFHAYPSDLNGAQYGDVLGAFYWFKKFYNKPWIIGETGAAGKTGANPPPAGWTSYNIQSHYADLSLKACVNCGASGYSWWEYQDVDHTMGTPSEYYGLLRINAYVNTIVDGIPVTVEGSYKQPTVSNFQDFGSYQPTYICDEPSEYYGPSTCVRKYTGKLINSVTGQPIEGGVLVLVDENYAEIASSYSKTDGTFTIKSNQDINIKYVRYSFLGMTKKDDVLLANTANLTLSGMTIPVGQSNTYNNNDYINVSNFTVAGNGTTGGNVTMYAEKQIVLTNTKVSKGGILKLESSKYLGTLYLSPISSCSIYGKRGDENVFTTGVDNSAQKDITNSIDIFPNPAQNLIKVNSRVEPIKEVIIYNIIGETVYIDNPNKIREHQIDLSSFNTGIYYVGITLDNGMSVTKKISVIR